MRVGVRWYVSRRSGAAIHTAGTPLVARGDAVVLRHVEGVAHADRALLEADVSDAPRTRDGNRHRGPLRGRLALTDARVRSHVEEPKLPLLGRVGDGAAVGEHADGVDFALGDEGAHALARGDVPEPHLRGDNQVTELRMAHSRT